MPIFDFRCTPCKHEVHDYFINRLHSSFELDPKKYDKDRLEFVMCDKCGKPMDRGYYTGRGPHIKDSYLSQLKKTILRRDGQLGQSAPDLGASAGTHNRPKERQIKQ